jgi:hypothetical protein
VLKKFQILEHFGFQIFRLGICCLHEDFFVRKIFFPIGIRFKFKCVLIPSGIMVFGTSINKIQGQA